jgi:hypothetical protein
VDLGPRSIEGVEDPNVGEGLLVVAIGAGVGVLLRKAFYEFSLLLSDVDLFRILSLLFRFVGLFLRAVFLVFMRLFARRSG